MNEKDLVILEQYDLHVQSTRRGRGSFLCDTDRGLVQVTEFSGSQERLFFQNRVLFFLTESIEFYMKRISIWKTENVIKD